MHSPGTGQGPGLDSGAAELFPHQSNYFSPTAATTGKKEHRVSAAVWTANTVVTCLVQQLAAPNRNRAVLVRAVLVCHLPWLSSAASLLLQPGSWCSRWEPPLSGWLLTNPSAVCAGCGDRGDRAHHPKQPEGKERAFQESGEPFLHQSKLSSSNSCSFLSLLLLAS